MINPAERLTHTEEYYFSRKLKEIQKLREEGHPVINLGIGSPDLMPPASVVESFRQAVEQPDMHGYGSYQGSPELRQAIAIFSNTHLATDLNANQVLPLIGSKEGITHISLAYLNPGDRVLIPELGYPTYGAVTKMVGAVPIFYPLKEEKGWEPDWEFLAGLNDPKIKLLWLNYPHMPTGTKGSREWLTRFVELASSKNWLLCHDNPYSFLQSEKPLSLQSIDGAMEVSVELNSLSKTFNMAGWRVGWVSGKEEILKPILQIKSNVDSGMFKGIQAAAIEALGVEDAWFESLSITYKERRSFTCKILDHLGCTYQEEQTGMFVWARVPSGDGELFSDQLLAEKKLFVTPGFIFGESGRDYIRVSLCNPMTVLEEVLNRLK